MHGNKRLKVLIAIMLAFQSAACDRAKQTPAPEFVEKHFAIETNQELTDALKNADYISVSTNLNGCLFTIGASKPEAKAMIADYIKRCSLIPAKNILKNSHTYGVVRIEVRFSTTEANNIANGYVESDTAAKDIQAITTAVWRLIPELNR